MKYIKLLSNFPVLVILGLASTHLEAKVDKVKKRSPDAITIAAYLQADNNLSPFADYNVKDMQQAVFSDGVNMLVQWDQPNNNRTWRYRITHGGKIEDASLSAEMGQDPEKELVDMMTWATSSYPAAKYAMILWNHGSGILDPNIRHISKDWNMPNRPKNVKPFYPWLQIPGISYKKRVKPKGDNNKPAATNAVDPKGILFDDSQNTYLNNQGLTNALMTIKKELLGGHNIDLIGMDACLMAMIEVGYQVKDACNVFVGSQNVEAGDGWAYSTWLTNACKDPYNLSAGSLGGMIVAAYGKFYQKRDNTATQSAIDLSKINAIGQNIDQMIEAVNVCKQADSRRISRAVKAARKASIEFDVADYIDLYSFYAALVRQVSKKSVKVSSAYTQAVAGLLAILEDGMQKITDSVIANSVGSAFAHAQGLSIYFPKGDVDESYPLTTFAQNTQWVNFVEDYQ